MQKYSKHLIVVLSGGGLATTGAIVLASILSKLEGTNIREHGFGWEISRLQMWPFFIIGAILGVIGVFCIVGTIMNLLSHDD